MHYSTIAQEDGAILLEKTKHYTKNGYTVLPSTSEKLVLDADQYIAIDDFVIKKGQSLKISSKSKLLFEAGCRLLVEGSLMIDSNVILSSVPASQRFLLFNKADTVWGGIVAKSSGSVNVRKTLITNATVGLDVENDSCKLNLQCLTFRNIKNVPFQLNEKKMVASDTACYSFINVVLSKPDDIRVTVNKPIPNSTGKKLHYRSSFILAGASVLCFSGSFFAEKQRLKYYNLAKNSQDGDNGEKKAWKSDRYLDARKGLRIVSATTGAAAIAVGITIRKINRGSHK
jgi:hypothetical protein